MGDKPNSGGNYIAIQEIRRKYCTKRLLNEIDKYAKIMAVDYDPFTNAQDFDVNWLKRLKISKDSIRDDIYHVFIRYGDEEADSEIKLSVVKEDRSYKIDTVYSILPLIDNYKKREKAIN